eukprot:3287809-Rhodomonas_salina.4
MHGTTPTPIVLRLRYAMPGPDIDYATTRSGHISQSLVQIPAYVVSGTKTSGTKMGYPAIAQCAARF